MRMMATKSENEMEKLANIKMTNNRGKCVFFVNFSGKKTKTKNKHQNS